MNVEDELHRIFTDDRLDLPTRQDADASILAGARQLRRRRIALITASGLAGAAVLAAGAFTIAEIVIPSSQPTVDVAASADQPGDSTVRLSADAAAHPLHEDVRQLFQTYFDAINDKEYGKFLGVITAKRAEGWPEEDWQRSYRSTRDGSILVRWIESGPEDVARVQVTFTSVQDLEDAPDDLKVPCIHWTTVFPLKIEDGTWNVDWAPASSTRVKC